MSIDAQQIPMRFITINRKVFGEFVSYDCLDWLEFFCIIPIN